MRKIFLYALLLVSQSLWSQRLLDADSHMSIAGASVFINGKIVASSDSSGMVRWQVNYSADDAISIQHPGYETIWAKGELLKREEKLYMYKKANSLERVIIKATRIQSNPTNTLYSSSDIKLLNTGRDIPIMLSQTPNAVSTSDAGNGIGYTGLRIRGVDPTRTNITINGIPLNDAESQGVYFVNMPDFASSLASIQIQRGLGSSTNGAGAFGSSINMQTLETQEKASSTLGIGLGYILPENSKNTAYSGNRTSALTNLMLQTGNINNWYISSRLSYIQSDGYVERSQSNLQSYYVSMTKKANNTLIKFLTFAGKEKTGQAWNGIPEELLTGVSGGKQVSKPNRVYNEFTYKNQTDNYKQSHYQLHINTALKNNQLFNIAFHYTRGLGYYEEYKTAQSFQTYGIDIDSSLHISITDLIRRRWLDNHFYGFVFSHIYNPRKWQLITGGGLNNYEGKHLGEVIWSQYAGQTQINHPYYRGNSNKVDANIYEKISFTAKDGLRFWADMQVRNIVYKTSGINDYYGGLLGYEVNKNYLFFNPKIGVDLITKSNGTFNLYIGMGNREPVRDDLVNAGNKSVPKPERLYDLELSHTYKKSKWLLQSNLYGMYYQNQLINDGSINDVGAYNRINVPSSYRVGIEVALQYKINKAWNWSFNVSLSQNKITSFNEYIDFYDSANNYIENKLNRVYKNVDLAFSPNGVMSSNLLWMASKNLSLTLVSKYVARQYLDNTQADERSIKAYFIHDVQLNYTWKSRNIGSMQLSILCNNILNQTYENNGYTFGAIINSQRANYNYYYPSAGLNFLGKLSCTF